MKIATILLVLGGIVLGVIAFNAERGEARAWELPTQAHLSRDVPAGYELLSFEVEGMCCQSCPEKLGGWLGSVEGVEQSVVLFEESCAEALVPEGTDPAPLLEALNQDKYTARLAP